MTATELPAEVMEDRFTARGFHIAHSAMLAVLFIIHLTVDGRLPGVAAALVVASVVWAVVVVRLGWMGGGPDIPRAVVAWLGFVLPWIALVELETFWLQALFTVFPMTFVTLVAPWSLAAALVPAATWSAQELQTDDPSLIEWLVLPVLTWLLSCAFSIWIERVIDQSEERAELLAALAATRAELAEIEREEAIRSERERMAREIHDTLAQGFTSIVLHSRAALSRLPEGDPATTTLRLVEGVASEHLAEARRLVHAGPRDTLGTQSLVDALRRVAEAEPPRAHLHVDGEVAGLGGTVDVAVLRIAQEAVANARKHAGASRIDVTISRSGGQVLLDVVDDGGGFDPGDAPTDVAGSVGGHGLVGMRQRAAELGGSLVIDSEPGQGTSISAALPVEAVELGSAP
ncbi:MAG: sensor histidine kinase [Actinomycetota bacterium]